MSNKTGHRLENQGFQVPDVNQENISRPCRSSASGRLAGKANWKNFGFSLSSIVLVIIIWYAVALVVTLWRGVPFPTPLGTAGRLVQALGGATLVDHSLYRHIGDSLVRWLAGFLAASCCGIAFGLAAGWWKTFEKITMPIVHILQLIPGLAWIPVAILMFGVGETSTFFLIAVTAFTPVAINVVSGVKQVDAMYIRAGRMLGAEGKTLFLRVLLPGALPQIISGLRIGLGNGWRVLVAAEMIVGTGTGLGYAIVQSRWTLDYASAFVCVMVICLIGLVVERGFFSPLEKMTLGKWGFRG